MRARRRPCKAPVRSSRLQWRRRIGRRRRLSSSRSESLRSEWKGARPSSECPSPLAWLHAVSLVRVSLSLVARLEALLADEASDMAAKLGEVAQVHREMAELQNLALRCHSTAPPAAAGHAAPALAPPIEEAPPGLPASNDGEGRGGSTPLRYQPAAGSNKIRLEDALDGMRLDGPRASEPGCPSLRRGMLKAAA